MWESWLFWYLLSLCVPVLTIQCTCYHLRSVVSLQIPTLALLSTILECTLLQPTPLSSLFNSCLISYLYLYVRVGIACRAFHQVTPPSAQSTRSFDGVLVVEQILQIQVQSYTQINLQRFQIKVNIKMELELLSGVSNTQY